MKKQDRLGIHILENINWLTFFKILAKLTGLLTTIYLTHVLTKKSYGLYMYALAFIPFFQAFTTEGIRVVSVRMASMLNDRKDILRLTSRIFSIRFVLGIFAYLLLVLLIALHREPSEQKFFTLIFLLIVVYSLNTQWIFQTLEKMKIIGGMNFLTQLLFLVIVMLFIRSDDDFLMLPYASIISEGIKIIIFLICTLLILSKDININTVRNLLPDRVFILDFLKQTIPISLSYLVIKLSNNLGIIFLDMTKSHEDVAIYSVAYKLSASINEFRTLIIFAVFPVLVKAWGRNKEVIKNLFNISIVFNALVLIPCAFLIMFFSESIINVLFSEKYTASSYVLYVLTINIIILWINMFSPVLLNATNNEKVYFKGHVFIFSVSILTLLVLIPPYGSAGLAFSRVACSIFSLSYFTYYVHKKLSLNLEKDFLVYIKKLIPVIIIFIISIYLFKLFNLNFPYIAILLLIFYYLILVSFKIIVKKDILLFLDLLKTGINHG